VNSINFKFIALASLFVGFNASAKVVDKIVAIVNDQIITLSDTEKFQVRLKNAGLVDEVLMMLGNPQTLQKDRNALLNEMIDEKVIDSEVKRKNMEVTIERVEEEIRNIARDNQISRNQLKEALGKQGVTMSQYQDFIKTSLERRTLIEREVKSKIRISDEDISSYYLSKKGPSGAQIFEYSLAHILFSPKNGGDDAALQRAKSVEEKLKQGQSFEKLAEQYSEDANFSKGGEMGTFRAGEMTKEIENAVKKTGPNETSPIVKTAQGYHIIKVLKRRLISDPKLEEEREALFRELSRDAFKRQFRLWLDQRRDEAFIRINGFPS
jgi:peptidyl-prolyl cis-trans isomerase SurA